MISLTQGYGLEGLPAKFDAADLNDEGQHQNDQEQWVVEEVLEHVQFSRFQLSCIDLVENLKQDEHMEEHGVVSSCLFVPMSMLHADGGLISENFRS